MSILSKLARCALLLLVLSFIPGTSGAKEKELLCDNPPCTGNGDENVPPMPTTCSGIANPAQQITCIDLYCSSRFNAGTPYCKYYADKKKRENAKNTRKRAKAAGPYDEELRSMKELEAQAGLRAKLQGRGRLDNGRSDSSVDGDDRNAPKPLTRPALSGYERVPEPAQSLKPVESSGTQSVD